MGMSQTCDVTIYEAREVIGEEATVCGELTQLAMPKGVRGNPVYLNMGKLYPNQVFTVVIWGRDFMQFPMGVLQTYEGKQIAVTGLVETYRGKPQIIVKQLNQLRVLE